MKTLTTARRLVFGLPGILFWIAGAMMFALAGGSKGVEEYLMAPARGWR